MKITMEKFLRGLASSTPALAQSIQLFTQFMLEDDYRKSMLIFKGEEVEAYKLGQEAKEKAEGAREVYFRTQEKVILEQLKMAESVYNEEKDLRSIEKQIADGRLTAMKQYRDPITGETGINALQGRKILDDLKRVKADIRQVNASASEMEANSFNINLKARQAGDLFKIGVIELFLKMAIDPSAKEDLNIAIKSLQVGGEGEGIPWDEFTDYVIKYAGSRLQPGNVFDSLIELTKQLSVLHGQMEVNKVGAVGDFMHQLSDPANKEMRQNVIGTKQVDMGKIKEAGESYHQLFDNMGMGQMAGMASQYYIEKLEFLFGTRGEDEMTPFPDLLFNYGAGSITSPLYLDAYDTKRETSLLTSRDKALRGLSPMRDIAGERKLKNIYEQSEEIQSSLNRYQPILGGF